MTSSQEPEPEVSYVDSMDALWERYGRDTHHEALSRFGESGILSEVKSLLSIGCGDGSIDELLISYCFPPEEDGNGFSRFVGVEPDAEMCEELTERMKTKFSTVTTSVHRSVIQDWQPELTEDGLPEKFDLIFMCEMLYYFSEESLGQLLERCVTQLLNPGGRILISLDTDAETSFYVAVVTKAWPDQCSFVPDSHAVERVCRDLLGDRVTFDRLDDRECTLNLKEPFEEALLMMYTHHVPGQSTPEGCERVRDVIREILAGRSEFKESTSALLISLL